MVDYCLGSLNRLSDFVEYLQNEWKIGYSGIIRYMNSLCHLLDFPRTFSNSASENICFSYIRNLFAKSETFPVQKNEVAME